jgi:hypothetical protein
LLLSQVASTSEGGMKLNMSSEKSALDTKAEGAERGEIRVDGGLRGLGFRMGFISSDRVGSVCGDRVGRFCGDRTGSISGDRMGSVSGDRVGRLICYTETRSTR